MYDPIPYEFMAGVYLLESGFGNKGCIGYIMNHMKQIKKQAWR
jgi:hypothetical protein